jgi:nucleoside-diphosphate-sugar epimerase
MRRLAFVTGATGFVGGHLVERLISAGWTVRALVRATSKTQSLEGAGVELFRGDLRDPAAIRAGAEGAEVVYHLAAVTAARSESEYEAANADGTAGVLEGIRLASSPPKRLVYLSSYAAAGPSRGGWPRSSLEEPAPLTGYGRTKLSGERIARKAEGNGQEVVVIRAPAVFGPGDRALLPYFRLLRRGVAPVPGGEDRPLHLIYVKDLAEALQRAADVSPGTYAVADPKVHLWRDVVATMAAILQKKPHWIPLPPRLVRGAAAVTESFGSVFGRAVAFNREKAEVMLAPGWVCDLTGSESLLPPPSVSQLVDAIEQTVRWYIRQGCL